VSELTLVPFARDHLRLFRPGPYDREVLNAVNISALMRHWPGRAIVALEERRVLGIAGAWIAGEKAHVWALLSDEMRRRFPLFLHRLARRLLRDLFVLDGVSAVEATVHPDFAASRRWLERIGFRLAAIEPDKVRYLKHAR
jgi:hypothetical protein